MIAHRFRRCLPRSRSIPQHRSQPATRRTVTAGARAPNSPIPATSNARPRNTEKPRKLRWMRIAVAQDISKGGDSVESRRGADSLHGPVSPPRSSNAACGFPALRSPTDFIPGHSVPGQDELDEAEARQVRHAPLRQRSGGCLASAPCDAGPGNDGRCDRRSGRSPGRR
jgi:hypothetical protein